MEPSPSVRTETLRLLLPAKRPLWRIAAGASAIGAGVLLIGFGVSAFVQNGTILNNGCPESFATKTCQFGTLVPGIGLTVTGALLTGAGAALLAWPPPKPKAQLASSEVGTSGSPTLGVRF